MPVQSYYPAFDVCRIDAQGLRVPLALETIQVYNVTGDISLGTLISDVFGIVAEGDFTAPVGTVIKISHLTYPGVCHFTLTATQEEAYTHAANDVAAYIAEDLSGTVDAPSAAAYFVDLDNPEIPPLYLGDVFPGTNTLAYISPIAKNGEIRIFSKAENLQTSGNDFRLAEGASVFVPGVTSGPRVLFDHFIDAPTTGTTLQTLYLDQIDAGTLVTNGDKVVADYEGIFEGNINEKIVILNFAGTDIFDSTEFGTIADGSTTAWNLEFKMTRVSNSVVRVLSELMAVNVLPFIKYVEITGLDLDANDYDLTLYGLTPDLAGDITAKMAHGIYWPAASVGTEYLLDESGDVLQDEGGDELSEG